MLRHALRFQDILFADSLYREQKLTCGCCVPRFGELWRQKLLRGSNWRPFDSVFRRMCHAQALLVRLVCSIQVHRHVWSPYALFPCECAEPTVTAKKCHAVRKAQVGCFPCLLVWFRSGPHDAVAPARRACCIDTKLSSAQK